MVRQRKLWVIVALAAMIGMASCARRGDALTTDVAPTPVFVSDNPQSIYAADPSDSWNRIFRALFTRTVNARVSDAFPEGAPFVNFRMNMGSSTLRLSKGKVSRTEIGDRAIEPLYPTFFTAKGIIEVFSDPLYSELTSELQQAIDEKKTRSPIERALMQADVWAAYDIIYGDEFNPTTVSAGRKTKLLDLLRQFIRKLALTSDEIRSLKNNYLRALSGNDLGAVSGSDLRAVSGNDLRAVSGSDLRALSGNDLRVVSGNDLRAVSGNDMRVVSGSRLPDLFAAESGWLEIELGPHRLHDDAARFRRAARVFVKPRTRPSDPARFVESLKFNQNVDQVEAVALVVQNLLINTSGRVVPAPLFTDVQFRFFKHDPKTGETSADAQQFELSRRKLLTAPLSGGFVEHSETSPAYLSVAGNDYDFATPIDEAGAPILVPLRTRCTQCHNRSLTTNLTFAIHDFPPVPTTRILKSSDHERALYVAHRKEQRADFKSLSPAQ